MTEPAWATQPLPLTPPDARLLGRWEPAAPAAGGLGLHLVARLCGARGRTVTAGRKHVWALIDLPRTEAPGLTPRMWSGR
ncbi:hypothetical protein ACI797_09095 [Geodermatophilus sp. SYSU D00691]